MSGSICNGLSNERLAPMPCPWCTLRREPEENWPVSLVCDVFDGYAGVSVVCGRCGFVWQSDDDRPLKDIPDGEREENIRLVLVAADRAAFGIERPEQR